MPRLHDVQRSLKNSTALIKKWAISSEPEPPSQHPRNAYRSLLRALTYTPDPVVRAVISEQARIRFEQKVVSRDRLAARLRRSATVTRCVEGANRGDPDDLKKVLENAYGKRGRRRRMLIRELLRPDVGDLPQDNKALEELIAGWHKGEVLASASNIEETAKFKAFRASHLNPREVSRDLHRGKTKTPGGEPKIPKENIWGRPMPRNRQASIKRKWWAATLEKMYPPIPEHEWNRLRDISIGIVRAEEPIPRRKASTSPELINAERWGDAGMKRVLDHLRDPARAKGKLVFQEGKGLYVEEPQREPPREPSQYQRTMRRLYGHIWQVSAKISKDEEEPAGWTVQWGQPLHSSHATTLKPEEVERFKELAPPHGSSGLTISNSATKRRMKGHMLEKGTEPKQDSNRCKGVADLNNDTSKKKETVRSFFISSEEQRVGRQHAKT